VEIQTAPLPDLAFGGGPIKKSLRAVREFVWKRRLYK
jgi:hypothetical protein